MADTEATRGSLHFVGNATTVLELGPFRLLTDPNFLHQGQRAYLGHGLTSKRLTEPAMAIQDLPPLDAIVLSHLHGDHWDRMATRHLDKDLPVLTTPHAAKHLHRRGFGRATGLRTWGTSTLHKDGQQLRINSAPGRHGPGPVDALLPPVMGTVLDLGPGGGPPALRVYISGDTLMDEDLLREIPQRYPGIDLAVLHLGGTRILRLVMVTMDAAQGTDLVELVQPRHAVPVHFDDYDVFTSPRSDFVAEMERRSHGDRLVLVDRGQTVTFGAGRPPTVA